MAGGMGSLAILASPSPAKARERPKFCRSLWFSAMRLVEASCGRRSLDGDVGGSQCAVAAAVVDEHPHVAGARRRLARRAWP